MGATAVYLCTDTQQQDQILCGSHPSRPFTTRFGGMSGELTDDMVAPHHQLPTRIYTQYYHGHSRSIYHALPLGLVDGSINRGYRDI